MTAEQFIDLSKRVHTWAKEKGWWDAPADAPANWERSWDELRANFHAEISEAWEEYRKGKTETYYENNVTGWKIDLTVDLKGRSNRFCIFNGGKHVAGPYESIEEAVKFIESIKKVSKPEGFWVEIADLLIRLADAFAYYSERSDSTWGSELLDLETEVLRLGAFRAWEKNPPVDVCRLHVVVGRSNSRHDMTRCVLNVLQYCDVCGIDILPIIEEKMAYNQTRPYRHGNLKA